MSNPGGRTRIRARTKDPPIRVWTVYLHACPHRVKGSRTTNATLRERFGIDKQNSAVISRLLSEAVEAGMIVVANPGTGHEAVPTCLSGPPQAARNPCPLFDGKH